MAPEVTLCADSSTLQHPECIGLADERLEMQTWLQICSDAQQARSCMREHTGRQEVWVAGSDQVDALNLAAALKRDRSDHKICLLAFQGSGSLYSRARAAGVDEVLDKRAFLSRYGGRKRQAMESGQPAVAGSPAASAGPASVGVPTAPNADAPAGSLSSHPIQASSSTQAHVLAVVGAGGGVGKSTIAVLCACIAQAKGYRTVLVDADLQFGDVHYLMGEDKALRLDELVSTPGRIDSLKAHDRMPAVLASPRRLEQSEQVVGQLSYVLDILRSRFDVIIVNTGPEWGDGHMQLLETGTNALFVLDQRPSSIRACKHALDLCTRCGIASQSFLFAINRCSRTSLFSSIDVSCALQGVHVSELQDGGRDVEEMLGAGQPLDLIDSRNALCVSLDRFLDKVLPQSMRASADAPVEDGHKRRSRFGVRRKKAACL